MFGTTLFYVAVHLRRNVIRSHLINHGVVHEMASSLVRHENGVRQTSVEAGLGSRYNPDAKVSGHFSPDVFIQPLVRPRGRSCRAAMQERLTFTWIRRSVAAGLTLGVAIAVSLTLLSMALDRWLKTETGLARSVSVGPGFAGPQLLPPTITQEISLAFVDDTPDAPRRYFSVRWEGYWRVVRDGAVDLYVGGDDRVRLKIDGQTILERNSARDSRTISREISLQAGLHGISVEFEQDAAGYSLHVLWAPAGRSPKAFEPESLFPNEPSAADLATNRRLRAFHTLVVGVWVLLGGILVWPAARPIGVRVARYSEAQRTWLRSATFDDLLPFVLPPLFGLSYFVLLLRWFLDPGQPDADGLLHRSQVVWPFVLVTFALAVVWLRVSRVRLRRMAKEAKRTWRLDRVDGALLLALAVGVAAYNAPAFFSPAGFFDSDSALYGLSAKHIADGLVPQAFALGRGVSGTFSSHLLAAFFVIGSPSVAAVIVLSRLLYGVFLFCHYVLLRFGFGRVVAASATLWLAFPGAFLSWNITLTEFGELFAFTGVATLIVAGRVTERLADDWWYVLAGVAVGFSFWAHPQTTIVGGAIVVTLFSLRGFRHTLEASRWLFVGFVVGTLPGLVGWGTFFPGYLGWLTRGSEGGMALSQLGSSLERIAREALPVLVFGHWHPVEVSRGSGAMLALVVLSASVWALAGLWPARRSASDVSGSRGPARIPSAETAVRTILALTVLFTFIAFTGSRFGQLIFPPRRLILLYAGVPALIAAAAGALARPLPRRLAGSCVVVTMVAWALVGAVPATEWMRQGLQRTARLEAGVSALEAAGVEYCEAPFWTAYWLNLATLERITCAQYEHYPDPYYRPVVDRRSPSPYRAYVVYNDGADDEAWLERARRDLEKQGVGYRSLSIPPLEALIPDR